MSDYKTLVVFHLVSCSKFFFLPLLFIVAPVTKLFSVDFSSFFFGRQFPGRYEAGRDGKISLECVYFFVGRAVAATTCAPERPPDCFAVDIFLSSSSSSRIVRVPSHRGESPIF